MKRKTIMESLGRVIEESSAEGLDSSGLTEETELESLGFDSLSVLDLIFDVEQETGVEMAPKDVLGMRTMGDLVTYIDVRM